MKLLLIDDDAFLRDMYATKFTDAGYEVVTADSGTVGLSLIERDPTYDIILMDMIMPGISGAELIAEIKQRFPEMKARCVVLSNQGQAEDVQAAEAAGVDDYIIKAESVPSDVLKKIEKLVKV